MNADRMEKAAWHKLKMKTIKLDISFDFKCHIMLVGFYSHILFVSMFFCVLFASHPYNTKMSHSFTSALCKIQITSLSMSFIVVIWRWLLLADILLLSRSHSLSCLLSLSLNFSLQFAKKRVFAFQVCRWKWYTIWKIGHILYLHVNFIKSNGIPAIIHIILNFAAIIGTAMLWNREIIMVCTMYNVCAANGTCMYT